MRVLLDTHTLVWWWQGNPRLSNATRELISDPSVDVYISAVSAFEIATKVRIRKLPEARKLVLRFNEAMAEQGFLHLPISARHALRAGFLDGTHRDPFDRLLAAQSIIEDMPVLTADTAIRELGAETFW